MKAWKHFCTITHHRILVMKGCFRVGLIWQGLAHDLQHGHKNAGEHQEKGYSEAWMHHKGRNRHHYEYWTDMNRFTRVYESVPMPRKYLVEMVMDRIAACRTYQGKAYTDASALIYFDKSAEKQLMHQQTRQELGHILTMLRDKGEQETFRYLRRNVLKGQPFPWEETAHV